MRFCALIAAVLLLSPIELSAADANRLTYLDDFCNPYYAHREFPKLTTRQWVGEQGVDAVVTLGIDDMRAVEKYEAYLRPILERLKAIDGRAAVSIMTCQIDPDHPHLQKWLKEGLSIETHTADHPCPCLQGGNFDQAKSTYDRSVDQISAIPGNRPVAFRFPCCDSLNTPSPRAFAEIVNRTTPGGNFLQLSSSVSAMLTADDPDLPRDLVLGADGWPRFSRYVPFPSFVNKVENYPYPFVIDRLCWEFPIAAPDDWQGYHLQGPNNPKTVEDIKAVIDATVIKRGVANIVFHPHGWIRSDQMVGVIDHVVERHGQKVKFLNFRECVERLTRHLLAGQPLRDEQGGDNGVRILDVNDDGYLDVVIGNEHLRSTRIWMPKLDKWQETAFPVQLVEVDRDGRHVDAGVRFGVLSERGSASVLVRNERTAGIWHFDGNRWIEEKRALAGLSIDAQPVFTARSGVDQGVRLRDLDRNGRCEVIVGNTQQQAVFTWSTEAKSWQRLPAALPAGATIVDARGRDQGLRFVDVDEDGHDDVLFSNQWRYGLYLFDSLKKGWSREVRAGERGGEGTIPMIARFGTNNGAWFAARHLWIQNEDTHKLPDGVDRRSFADLLGSQPARPKTPEASLRSIEVPEGFGVQLVAAEPLVMDPVAIDWGPDGRLWVVEMADYPLGVDGQSKPGGRVRWLEDTDGDGVYDGSTLFLENLSTPTGIMVWRDGVLITAAPDVLYAEDTDGDGKADRTDVLFTGFGKGNQQHRVNGFAWGLDNWIYLANGDSGGTIVSTKTGAKVDIRGRDVRIRPDEGLIEAVAGQSQFGRSRDDWGNWFGCNNPNPIFHFVLDDHYLRRNPHLSPPASRRDIREGSQLVYPISPNISHCDPKYRPLGTPAKFTSCNSTIAYRDDLFGAAYVHSTFTSEPVYNIVHRRVLVPDGVTFRSLRSDDEQGTEFFRSSDAWCRPTSLRVGPDGALYIADMYREVIEHPEWINDELEKQIDVRAGHDRGRIYRVAPVGVPRRPVPRLDQMSTAELVAALDSPSGWQRDMVHRMLIWRADPDSISTLADQVFTSHDKDPRARLHALCILDGLGALDEDLVARGLQDHHPVIQRHAIRLFEPFLKAADGPQRLVDSLFGTTEVQDPIARLQYAYALGHWQNTGFSDTALGQLAINHCDDEYLMAAILSSANSNNITGMISTVISRSKGEESQRQLTNRLIVLAAAFGKNDVVVDLLDSYSRPGRDGKPDADGFQTVATILDTLADRTQSLPRLANARVQGQVKTMLASARTLAMVQSTDDTKRIDAIRLLARDENEIDADIRKLATLLESRHSAALHEAAIHRLTRLSHEGVFDQLFQGWLNYTPSLRREVLDVVLTRETGTRALLTKLEAGEMAAALMDATCRDRLLNHKDKEIRGRAQKLFSQPTNSDRQAVIDRHRDVPRLAGDMARGKLVFEKRCAACHKLEGVGHHVGPDLTALKDRSPETLLVALLDPNRAVEEKYLAYEVITTDGRILTGVIAEESGNTISLKDSSGKQHDILRNQIDDLRATARSLMPEGLEKDISQQELANVIRYVTTVVTSVTNE